MSDLQCAARIVLVRPGHEASVPDDLARGADIVRPDVGERIDLEALADLRRGETVVLVTDTGLHVERGEDAVLVEIDGDGWRVTALSGGDA